MVERPEAEEQAQERGVWENNRRSPPRDLGEVYGAVEPLLDDVMGVFHAVHADAARARGKRER